MLGADAALDDVADAARAVEGAVGDGAAQDLGGVVAGDLGLAQQAGQPGGAVFGGDALPVVRG